MNVFARGGGRSHSMWYVCVPGAYVVYVCVCERERERERKGEKERVSMIYTVWLWSANASACVWSIGQCIWQRLRSVTCVSMQARGMCVCVRARARACVRVFLSVCARACAYCAEMHVYSFTPMSVGGL